MNHRNNLKNTETLENFNIFWNFSLDKGRLKSFVSWFLTQYGEKKTIQLLEQLKELGFGYATKAGISLGIEDLKIPPQKSQLLRFAEMNLARGIISYRRGQCTGIEKMQQFIETWHETSENLKQEVVRYFEKTDVLNPVYMMAFSGARGNLSQVRQLVGMRGLMSDPQGKIIDFPIQSNFREGLTLTEYLISTYGARKGIVDTALRTATAGYLTRRLVDVAQHVVVSKFDCGTERGIFLFDMKDGPKTIYSFQNRLTGRVLARDILISPLIETATDSNRSKKIGFRNQEITSDLARAISQITKKALVRSPLTCEARKFVCQLCYGWSLATSRLVSIGEAVGVIAGQSIGEPGTQLTMRTFHTGGVFSGGITEQIHAPFDGLAQYSEPIAGTCVRTSQGELVFLTKSTGTLFFKSLQEIPSVQSNSEAGLEENSSFITNAYKIPPFTILFARHGQVVKKKNLLAQISMVTAQQKAMQTIEQTIYSNLEGEIYYSQLDLLEDIDEKSGERISKSEDWAKVWVLSGKIFKDSLNSTFFAKKIDYVSKNSIINQIQWVNNFSELTKFEYLLPQFKHDSNLDLNSFFYINSNSQKKNFMSVLKRNENYMHFLNSRKFSLSSNSFILNNSAKAFYINSKRSIRDKFLTQQIQSENFTTIQTYSFYPFKSNLRKIFLNTFSQTILSLPILSPGILKKVIKKQPLKSKKSQKFLNYSELNKANQKILIRKLNLNKNFQIYNGKKPNLFHPLILSNSISFFLNVQSLKYHFKRKPPVFPLVRQTPIFLTNFSLKTQKDQINTNFKKLTILKYQDELLYKKLLFKNKQVFTPLNSNFKFSDRKKVLKSNAKNSLKKPLKKLYISNPIILLNSAVNRYQKLGYLTSVQIHGNEKDEFFSFLPLKTDDIKPVNLNFSNPSKMNSQMFIKAKNNLNFNAFSTKDQNLGLKNTYSWDFPSVEGFYWYPKFFQSLTNGIFIFSNPFLSQQKFQQKMLQSKTKNFKTAFLGMKKYSLFLNIAQSQLKKKKNTTFFISNNNINHKKFIRFTKYRVNTLNFSSEFNFHQNQTKFKSQIFKSQSARFNPIYFSNFNKKDYLNKFKFYFLNPKTSKQFKNQHSNSKIGFEFLKLNNFNFKNSSSQVNGYLQQNIANRLFLDKLNQNNIVLKYPENLSIKFDLSKKFSASCHEIYWLPQENYLLKTWLKANEFGNFKSNNILFTEKTSKSSFKSSNQVFYLTNTQGFKKQFNLKQEGICRVNIVKKSSISKNTFKLKKTNKSANNISKPKKTKVVFRENFQIPYDSLKKQMFLTSEKNLTSTQKSDLALKKKFLNFLKKRKISTISELKKFSSKHSLMKNEGFNKQTLNFSSLKKMPYKSFLSFIPFVKRKILEKPINFDSEFKKAKFKKPFKVYKKTLQISIKSGWVYKTTNVANILNLDKAWINSGRLIIDDVCFEQQKVFVEILSINDKLEKDSIKSPQISSPMPNQFKPSIFIKNPKCRFYKNFSNDKKKFDKTKIVNPLNSSTTQEIFLFIRPLNYFILPNLYEMKKNLNVAMQKTKNNSLNISYFIFQKYYVDSLNTQRNATQLISQFAPLDFQLNWSNSFTGKDEFLKESFLEKVKWKKKKSQKKTFKKVNFLNSILELQKFKDSNFLKEKNSFIKNSYLDICDKLRYDILNKNHEKIYFSQYPVNFLKLKVSVNNYNRNFSSALKISLNSSFFESDNILKSSKNQNLMNNQIKNTYLDILLNRSLKKSLLSKNQNCLGFQLNFNQKGTNSFQKFKQEKHSKVSFQSKKLVSFKLFSQVGTSIPNFELSYLDKYAYFANQRIFSSYFYKEQMSNHLKLSLMNPKNYSNESLSIKRFVLTDSLSSGLSEAYSDSPIITNQFIANHSNLKTQKIFGLTNFYSPYEGEVLKIYSPTQDLNILKNGFNTILEQGFIQDRQNQKLILTKSDLFSLKFLPIQKKMPLTRSENPQKIFSDELQKFQNDSSPDFSTFSQKSVLKKSFQSLCDFHQEFKRAEEDFNITMSKKDYQIQNVNMLYNHKRYKVKELNFSLFSDLKKIRLGQFLSPGDLLNGQLTLTKCGQVIHYNSKRLTLRKAEFFSLSPKAILHKYNGHFLQKNSPVMTLPFQTLKTGDIVQGIPKVEQYLEARTTLQGRLFLNSLPVLLHAIFIRYLSHLEMDKAVRQSFLKIQQILVDGVQRVYRSQGVSIADKHLEIIVRQMTSKVQVIHGGQTGFFPGELLELEFVEKVNQFLMVKIRYEPVVLGITRASLEVDSFLSAASFQQTTKILTRSALENKKDFLKGLKENLLVGNLLPAGTGYVRPVLYE